MSKWLALFAYGPTIIGPLNHRLLLTGASGARLRRTQRSVVALRNVEFNAAGTSPQLKRGSLGRTFGRGPWSLTILRRFLSSMGGIK